MLRAPMTIEDGAPRNRVSPVIAAALIFLCGLSIVVRLWGVGYLLPMVKLGDASYVVRQVEVLRSSDPPDYKDPSINCYPFLLARTVALFPDRTRIASDEALDLPGHLARAGTRWREIRIVSALYSLFLIPGTWFLARKFMSDAWALLAAAFVATSLLHVEFAAQEPPHALVTSAILLGVLAAIRLRRRGDVASYLGAGAAAGIAIGSLQSGACVLPAVAAAVVLRERSDGRERRASAWWLVASLAIVVLAVRWLYPFHFVGDPSDLSIVDRQEHSLLMLSGHEIFLHQFNGLGFGNTLHAVWCYDPLLLAAVIAGFAFFAWRLRAAPRAERPWLADMSPRTKDMLVVAAQAVPYYIMIGIYAQSFERFVMPLLPALACIGAYGVRSSIDALARRVPLGRAATIMFGASLPLVATVPVLRLAHVRAAPATQLMAAGWILDHVGADERIVIVPHIDLPLFASEQALAKNMQKPRLSDWFRYQSGLRPEQRIGPRFEVYPVPGAGANGQKLLVEDPMAYFAAHAARYVVLALSSGPEAYAIEHARAELQRHARLVYRSSPERIDSGDSVTVTLRHPDPAPDSPIFERPYAFWLFDIERMGRSMEIYRLD
jgi:hypothetical protein